MSSSMVSADVARNTTPGRVRWWHAALFWVAVNAPGWIVPWREVLFPGFIAPALRPPGEAFPIIWFIITVAVLWADVRILNDRGIQRRQRHLWLQALFWLAYLVFPVFFFCLSSPIAGFVLTLGIFAVAATEMVLLWSDDRRSALLLLPLLLWSGFAGLYVAPVQALLNPDPLLGTAAPFQDPAGRR